MVNLADKGIGRLQIIKIGQMNFSLKVPFLPVVYRCLIFNYFAMLMSFH